uniref:Uncharacterized protein n=1 Tax=viral metagenome TaxID=1070528 RepID=A0A6M3ITV3_9ZZZZ
MSIDEMIEFIEKTKRSIKLTNKGSQFISDVFESVAQNRGNITKAEKEIREFVNAILKFLTSADIGKEVKIKKRVIKKKDI